MGPGVAKVSRTERKCTAPDQSRTVPREYWRFNLVRRCARSLIRVIIRLRFINQPHLQQTSACSLSLLSFRRWAEVRDETCTVTCITPSEGDSTYM